MTLLLLVAAVVFVALAVGPRTGRYQTLTMLTGSMSPAIDAGDVVVVVPVRPADVRVGDVITFEAPVADRHVVTHRVVGLDTSGSRPRLQTKGDANAVRDPWDAEITDDVAWRVRYVVPGAGSLLQRLREPGVQLLLRWAVPAILLAWSLLAIWRPRRDDA